MAGYCYEALVTEHTDFSHITASFSFDESLEQQSKAYKHALAAEFKKLSGAVVIVSGGISSIEDIKTAHQRNIDAVIVGRAMYENKLGDIFNTPFRFS